MYKYTALYANRIRNFLKDAKAIEAKHQQQLDYLQQFADSQSGKEEIKKIKAARAAEIDGIREKYAGLVQESIGSMRGEISRKLSTPPTADQVATLQLLSMREKLGRDELKAVVPALQSCPMAIQALRELTAKHGIFGVGIPITPSTESAEETFGVLNRSAEKLIYRYGSEKWGSGGFVDSIDAKRMETDGDDAEVFRVYGCVTDFEPFQQLVDHPDGTGI